MSDYREEVIKAAASVVWSSGDDREPVRAVCEDMADAMLAVLNPEMRRMRIALEVIRDDDGVENVHNPQWASQLAGLILSRCDEERPA